MFLGKPSKIIMKHDTPEESMEIIKKIYPNAEIVRAEKEDKDVESR